MKNIYIYIYIYIYILGYLDKEIKGEPREQNVGHELDDVENSEHHPVNQPLRVVFFGFTLHGFHSERNPAGKSI